jgi:hypothetical protein
VLGLKKSVVSDGSGARASEILILAEPMLAENSGKGIISAKITMRSINPFFIVNPPKKAKL